MIGVIGQGFVGNAIYQKFKKYYDIKTYDLDSSKCNSSKEEVLKQDIIFVCLPTPMNQDGTCNISIVERAINDIDDTQLPKLAVIKSTIPPGTTDKLNKKYSNLDIVFNPEFLTEANAVDDFENQTRIILGGSNETTTKLKQILILLN